MTPDLLTDMAARCTRFAEPDAIRARFAHAMSAMYRAEVPQYGALLDLVADVNARTLHREPDALGADARARLDIERHGAIRLGTARELHTMRRVFAVMGMQPVGYYDLSVAGVPVHSTAFRPVDPTALAANPFRVFTSLLRLDLVQDKSLRAAAERILANRQIFTPAALALTERCEARRGLTGEEAEAFVHEVLQTFRWQGRATVDRATYERLHDAHRLVADVVCFPGPHINHLTPRTLDIDAAQAEMPGRGIAAKEVVEGPPPRRVPILLRQTSFKALQEKVRFVGGEGAHTARFGEIEQRGVALTRKGRALYDRLLEEVRRQEGADYSARLAQAFEAFPDDVDTLRREGLAFFHYRLLEVGKAPALPRPRVADRRPTPDGMEALIEAGRVTASPITYEDFLPVSAAGIFQSNLGGASTQAYSASAAQAAFEEALGAGVRDEFALYEAEQSASIAQVRAALQSGAAA